MFFHVLSCSFFVFVGAQNLIFLGPQFRYDFSSQFSGEKSIFGPISGGNPSGPFVFFLAFNFSFFSFFVRFFIFLIL